MNAGTGTKMVMAAALGLALLGSVGGLLSPSAAGPDDWEAKWNKLQPAGKVMDAVGIEPGMVVAEFGAGKGRYAVQVAARVGPEGKVYAEDIDEDALAYLKKRCERDAVTNIETVLGDATDPKLPPGSCDFVYCINTYHHIGEPVPLLRNIAPALKPGGRLVIIEHSPEKTKEDPHEGECTPAGVVMAQAREAGYELVERHSFLELDEIYVFQAAKKERPKE